MTDGVFDQIFPLGETNDGYAAFFSGQSYLAPLVGGSVPVSNVTFEPGCRNNWHVHHGVDGGGDQILLCTAGSGWYQAVGEDPISMTPGSVVRVPAGTRHWHGAKADSWFSHLAFITPGDGARNEWLEPVSDAEYIALHTPGDRPRDWTAGQLDWIRTHDDLHVSPFRDDGSTPGTPTWIWSVVVDEHVYVRAYNGVDSRWYRSASVQAAGTITSHGNTVGVSFTPVNATDDLDDRIDAAYSQKYAGSPYLPPMLSSRTRAATVRIDPR